MVETLPPQKKAFPSFIIFIVIIVLLAGLSGYLYWMADQEVRSRKSLSARLTTAEQEKAQFAQELEKAKSDLQVLQSTVDGMSKDLEKAKADAVSAKTELAQKTEEIVKIQNDSQKRVSELEEDIKRYADFSAALTLELKPIREALVSQRLPSANPTQETNSETPAGSSNVQKSVDLITGKVTLVNKGFGFVLVNVGSNAGITPGRPVQIYQKEEAVGLGRIEKVHEESSAVSIASEDLIGRIQPGDKVVFI